MRIAVCCKEPLLRDSIASLMHHEGGFQVVVKASDLKSCVTMAKESGAQVVVAHYEGINKQDLTFLSGAKAFGNFGTVLISSGEKNELTGSEAFDKDVPFKSDAEALFGAIHELRAEGKIRSIGGVRESRAAYGYGELTRREYEVAQLVSKGFSNRRIAQATGLQEQSIKNLVSVIMRKLKCENRVQVALRLTSVKSNNPAAVSSGA